MFTLFGTTIIWKANQQYMVALYTNQVKYIFLIEAVKRAIWMRDMIKELEIIQEHVKINCDSQNIIYLANHQVYHERKNT